MLLLAITRSAPVAQGASAAAAAATAPADSQMRLAPVFEGLLAAQDGTTREACDRRWRPGTAGVATRTVDVPAAGAVQVRLSGERGDWDVAVFDGTGQAIAADASPDAQEVASGWTLSAGTLRVQACRLSGDADAVPALVEFARLKGDAQAAKAYPPQLVNVITPTRAEKDRLTALGVDMTEHGGEKTLGVVLHNKADRDKLLQAGFRWRVLVPDLVAQSAEQSAADARLSTRSAGAALPSGRTTYRTLANYNNDLKQLAADNPDLVKLFVLPNKTFEGREVMGVEIAKNVGANDGRPAFLNMGVHHAREWPSGESAMEWAIELVNGYKGGDPRTIKIMENSRNIVVPVVNPDGFNASRTAAVGADGGRDESIDDTFYLVAGGASGGEYRRKNCRLPNNANAGNCLTSFGLLEPGVDPNRNYGGLWGGPGADASNVFTQTYRGPGPFSEPETKNIQALVSRNQVVTLITNHTTAGLVLRAPGIASLGDPVDEHRGYKDLGDEMALHNGYFSQNSYELYDTTGTTEDWTYNTAGGYGFTFEIYCGEPNYKTGDCDDPAFHPRFARVIEEWEGTSPQADHKDDPGRSEEAPFGNVKGFDGKGNREAYYIAAESTLNEARHSVLEGEVPPGTTLRLKKQFKTQTFPQASNGGKPLEFDDTLETTLDVGPSGRFSWHTNPSTRPIVAKDQGDKFAGAPSPPTKQAGGPQGRTNPPEPGTDGAVPSGETDAPSTSYNDHPVVVPSDGGINKSVNMRVVWETPASDWDVRLYEDANGDGKSQDETQVAASENGATSEEELGVTGDPTLEPGKKYVLRVTNFAAVEPYDVEIKWNGPLPFQPAQVEAYTLTCERGGQVLETQQVVIDRGERKRLELSACAGAARGAPPTPRQPTPAPRGRDGGGNGGGGCAAGAGFRSVSVAPSGGGARLGFSRRVDRPVSVSVFQQSRGRRVTGERLVARFTGRSSTVKWNGKANRRGKRVTDGFYFVRYRMETPQGDVDTRRVTLRRKSGRFSRQPDFYRRATCDLLPSFKLTRPVFGGSGRPANLGVAYRVAETATVAVEIRRGSRIVRRRSPRTVQPNRTTRLRVRSTGLPRGKYVVRLTVRGSNGRTVTSSLVARRL